VIPLLEEIEDIDNADEILAIDGVDIVFLGPFDYSVALGIPGQVEDARVQDFIARAAKIARAAGKAVGTTAMSEAQTARLTSLGVNVLLYGTDTWLLGQGARAGLAMYQQSGWSPR